MKKAICIALFYTVVITSYAQEYFNNRYDFYLFQDAASYVEEVNDGYIAAGIVVDSTTLNQAFGIIKVDTEGNLVWKKSYGKAAHNYFSGFSGTKTHDGSYAVAGSVDDTTGNDDVFLWLFDSNGDTLWTKRYSDLGFEAGAQIRQTLDSGFVVIGFETIGNTQVLLMKVNKDGNVEWKKNYNYGGNSYGYNIQLCSDKGYIIGGVNNSSTRKSLIIKTDSLGNVEWTKQYGGLFDNCRTVVKQSSDGGFVVGSCEGVYELNSTEQQRAKIIKLDVNGDEEWSSLYGHPRANAEPFTIHELNSGDIVMLGQQADTSLLQQSTGWPEGYLLKVSSTGDSIWHRVIEHLTGPQSLNYPRDMQVTTDGGFVVSGWCTPAPPDVGTQDMWVIKLDSMGCAQSGCDTLTGVSEQVTRQQLVKVYPNPSKGTFTVQSNQQGTFTITDLTGRQVVTGKLNEELILNQPNGIYLIRVGTTVKKLVLKK